jgi:hypothetical protein
LKKLSKRFLLYKTPAQPLAEPNTSELESTYSSDELNVLMSPDPEIKSVMWTSLHQNRQDTWHLPFRVLSYFTW